MPSLRPCSARAALLLAFLLTVIVGTPLARSDVATPPTRAQLEEQISILQDDVKKLQSKLDGKGGEVYTAYLEAKKREYQFQIELMESNINTLKAQWWASHAVLFLVILVVCSGVVFSGFQLWKSVSVAGVQTNSDLEVSAAKVRVTSSVVGVTVLTLSLLFLYIYTREVYQLKVIDPYSAKIEQPNLQKP